METLCRFCQSNSPDFERWNPTRIHVFRNLCEVRFPDGSGNISRSREIATDFAHTLQFSEFLIRSLDDMYLTDALQRQTFKSFAVASAGIIELLFWCLLQESSNQSNGDFSQLIGRVRNLGLMPNRDRIWFGKLNNLRNLRNRVHLRIFRANVALDYDYYNFTRTVLTESKSLLKDVIADVFQPTAGEVGIFYFLE